MQGWVGVGGLCVCVCGGGGLCSGRTSSSVYHQFSIDPRDVFTHIIQGCCSGVGLSASEVNLNHIYDEEKQFTQNDCVFKRNSLTRKALKTSTNA